MPVANIGILMASLQKAVAMKASATTWTTAPTADQRAPRTLGGMGVLASGTAVTTYEKVNFKPYNFNHVTLDY